MGARGNGDLHELAGLRLDARKSPVDLRPPAGEHRIRDDEPGRIGRFGPHRPTSRRAPDEKRVSRRPFQPHAVLGAAVHEDSSVRPGIDLHEVQTEARVQLRGAEGELRVQEQVLHAPGVERCTSRGEVPWLDDVYGVREVLEAADVPSAGTPCARRQCVIAAQLFEHQVCRGVRRKKRMKRENTIVPDLLLQSREERRGGRQDRRLSDGVDVAGEDEQLERRKTRERACARASRRSPSGALRPRDQVVETRRREKAERERQEEQYAGQVQVRAFRERPRERASVDDSQENQGRACPESALGVASQAAQAERYEKQNREGHGRSRLDRMRVRVVGPDETAKGDERQDEGMSSFPEPRGAGGVVLEKGQQERSRESAPEKTGQGRPAERGECPSAERRVCRGEESRQERGLGMTARENDVRCDDEAREIASRGTFREAPSEEQQEGNSRYRQRLRVLEPRDERRRKREGERAETGGRTRPPAIPKPQECGGRREEGAKEERQVPTRPDPEEKRGPDERGSQRRARAAEQRYASVLVRVPEREPARRHLPARELEPGHELPDGVRKRRGFELRRPERRRPGPEARLHVVRQDEPLVHPKPGSEGDAEDEEGGEAGKAIQTKGGHPRMLRGRFEAAETVV